MQIRAPSDGLQLLASVCTAMAMYTTDAATGMMMAWCALLSGIVMLMLPIQSGVHAAFLWWLAIIWLPMQLPLSVTYPVLMAMAGIAFVQTRSAGESQLQDAWCIVIMCVGAYSLHGSMWATASLALSALSQHRQLQATVCQYLW